MANLARFVATFETIGGNDQSVGFLGVDQSVSRLFGQICSLFRLSRKIVEQLSIFQSIQESM